MVAAALQQLRGGRALHQCVALGFEAPARRRAALCAREGLLSPPLWRGKLAKQLGAQRAVSRLRLAAYAATSWRSGRATS